MFRNTLLQQYIENGPICIVAKFCLNIACDISILQNNFPANVPAKFRAVEGTERTCANYEMHSCFFIILLFFSYFVFFSL